MLLLFISLVLLFVYFILGFLFYRCCKCYTEESSKEYQTVLVLLWPLWLFICVVFMTFRLAEHITSFIFHESDQQEKNQ